MSKKKKETIRKVCAIVWFINSLARSSQNCLQTSRERKVILTKGRGEGHI